MAVAVSTPSSHWSEVEVNRVPRLHILHRTKGGSVSGQVISEPKRTPEDASLDAPAALPASKCQLRRSLNEKHVLVAGTGSTAPAHHREQRLLSSCFVNRVVSVRA